MSSEHLNALFEDDRTTLAGTPNDILGEVPGSYSYPFSSRLKATRRYAPVFQDGRNSHAK